MLSACFCVGLLTNVWVRVCRKCVAKVSRMMEISITAKMVSFQINGWDVPGLSDCKKKSDREEERKWQRIVGLATIIDGLPSQKDDPHTCLSELASSPSVSATHTHPHLLNQSLFRFSSHLLFPFHFFQEFATSAFHWMSVCICFLFCVFVLALLSGPSHVETCVFDSAETTEIPRSVPLPPSNTEPMCVCEPPVPCKPSVWKQDMPAHTYRFTHTCTLIHSYWYVSVLELNN